MNKNPLVYYAVDEKFFPYALASCINSIETANRSDIDYAILCQKSNILKKGREIAERYGISIYEISRRDVFSLRHCRPGGYDEAIFYILLIDRFVSSDRELVLFLDADTLTQPGWDSIFDIEFSGELISAASSLIFETKQTKIADRLSRIFKLNHENARSINSGVTLFNYTAAIEADLFERTRNIVRTHEGRPNDQEALCVAVNGIVKPLPSEYNFIPKKENNETAKIRHFAYVDKPWFINKGNQKKQDPDAKRYRSLLQEFGFSNYMDIPHAPKKRKFLETVESKISQLIYTKSLRRKKIR